MRRDKESVTYDGEVRRRTDAAVLFWVEDLDTEIWFPLSQCELNKDQTSILVPRWLARSKGLD